MEPLYKFGVMRAALAALAAQLLLTESAVVIKRVDRRKSKPYRAVGRGRAHKQYLLKGVRP